MVKARVVKVFMVTCVLGIWGVGTNRTIEDYIK